MWRVALSGVNPLGMEQIEVIRQAITEQIRLLELERSAQQTFYRSLLEEKPVRYRVEQGFSWFPVHITSSGFALGEMPYVELEFQKADQHAHQFQSGKPVQLFVQSDDREDRPVKGIIHWLHKKSMRIYLHADDLPDWLHQGRVGVDLLYDEQTFRDMQVMLKTMLNEPAGSATLQMAASLYAGQPARYDREQRELLPNVLNSSQQEAVQAALASETVCIIHGPPGTGKTTTLIQLIKELVRQGEQVLVCAPSNTAVDWLTLLLQKQGLNALRMGHLSRMDQEVLESSLEQKLAKHDEAKHLKKIRMQAEELRRLAGSYKRHFGPEERAQRSRLLREARELSSWSKELEHRITDDIIDQAQVITCTLSGSHSQHLRQRRFKTCIIDEAAQALQASCWLAMSKADRAVLAGDPFQLPPTVKDEQAARQGLTVTLLDLAIQAGMNLHLLQVQYRMHAHIMQFSNQWFYSGRLVAHDSAGQRTLGSAQAAMPVLEFIDTAGCGFQEERCAQTGSYLNRDEYRLLREHMDPFLHQVWQENPRIGVLSPYKAQVLYMQEEIIADYPEGFDISIQTVDGFQGQERDIIYISLVRSNDEQQIGFLKDYRRMNVAMTRSRKKLIIIGDSATIGGDPFFGAFLQYVESIDAYRSAWEFIA
jgi:ATP-dependent RNA/DNA helicase IGHMBP2